MTMNMIDLYASLFELPSLPQFGNYGGARAATVAPVRREGMAK
jgi:hypothetical protein